MTVKTMSLSVSTKGHADMIDITDDVGILVRDCGIKNGLLTVFSPSATSALTTIEYESGCLSDLKRLFDEIAPVDRDYQHNIKWGDGNGHSHVRAALLKSSFSVPISEGRLMLGTWQQIIFADFDNRSRKRELVVQIMGE